MSRIFHRAESGWASRPLAPGRELCLDAESASGPGFVKPGRAAGSRVVRAAGEAAAAVDVLFVAPGGAGVLVGGMPVAAGVRVLADRDAIACGPAWHFYAAADPAVVEEFPGERFSEPVFCVRCNADLSGCKAVRCPVCQIWYHQDGERDCYSYGPCVSCGTPPSLGGAGWTPEEV